MSRLISGLIQMSLKGDVSMTPEEIRERMLEAHLPLIDEAGAKGDSGQVHGDSDVC